MGSPMRHQPQGRIRLNAGHPLARALSFAWVASAPDINLVTGRAATTRGTAPAKESYLTRQGRKFIGSGSIDFGNTPDTNFGGLSQQTMFVEAFIPDTSVVNGFMLGRVQSTWDYYLQINSVAQQVTYGGGGDSGGVSWPASSATSALVPLQGRPVAFTGTYDKTNEKLYIDGALKNTKAFTGSFATGGDPFALGARGGGGQTSVTGIYLGIVLIFKRVLSDTEILSLSQNPWQLFDAGSGSSAYQAAIVTTGTAPVIPPSNTAPGGASLFLNGAGQFVKAAGSNVVPPAIRLLARGTGGWRAAERRWCLARSGVGTRPPHKL